MGTCKNQKRKKINVLVTFLIESKSSATCRIRDVLLVDAGIHDRWIFTVSQLSTRPTRCNDTLNHNTHLDVCLSLTLKCRVRRIGTLFQLFLFHRVVD